MSQPPASILLVDDDVAILTVLSALLQQAGFSVLQASSGAAAIRLLEERPVDLVITDLRMPGMDGMTLLSRVARGWPGLPLLVLSAHGTIALAVEAMKVGAADFLTKPFDRDEVLFVVQKALRSVAQADERPSPTSFEALGTSEAMAETRDTARRAAASHSTVLITGETGVGKEVVARAIHEASTRRSGPFIKLNCAAFPDSLLESELFGYEKGAFTGAQQRKPGRIELAHGGTLLLDEIGDISPMTQAKLLRVLQFKELERLGGTQAVAVDVRFLAATHRDLHAMCEAGTFRRDLYYRLDVVRIDVPPLRERRADIVELSRQFARNAAHANAREAALEPAALERLEQQTWPGNVRQLENFMERLVVLSDGPRITLADVERELSRDAQRARASARPQSEPPLDAQRREAERRAIADALQRASGNRSLAARLLGVSRRTLYTKLAELDLLEPSAD